MMVAAVVLDFSRLHLTFLYPFPFCWFYHDASAVCMLLPGACDPNFTQS